MANFIPEEKISEIRSAADIVEVISEVVQLKRAGKNFVGLCPFHAEKTPSFTVSVDKQIFYCFGCGTGGNIFSFVMKHEGLSFPEAARALANRYGIQLPVRQLSAEEKKRQSIKEQLFDLNRRVAEYYHRLLLDSAGAKAARDYLAGRGITKETVAGFQLGYAPESWDTIVRFLKKVRSPLSVAENCGLVVPRKDHSGYYDRFRGRIMFPIQDFKGAVIGFGGRVMDDSLPKYLNSPETPVYHKSRSLYGVNLARGSCREKETVYIVEGYFDLIALHQHGIRNVVATLGTALTEEHLRILRGAIGEKGRVILVYDSDEAGIMAARRSIPLFDKGYVNAQILTLTPGYDPDTYIFEFGPEAFSRTAESAKNIIPFLLDCAVKEHGLSVDGKVRIVDDLLAPLFSVNDSVERALYLKEIAERLGIDERAIAAKLREAAQKMGGPKRTVLSSGRVEDPSASDHEKSLAFLNETIRRSHRGRLEKQLISMMLQFPPIIAEISKHRVLDYFENSVLKQIGDAVCSRSDNRAAARHSESKGETPATESRIDDITRGLEDEAVQQLVMQLAMEEEDWNFEACVKLINHFVETGRKRNALRDIERRIKEAERSNDQALLEKLLTEKQNMAVLREKRKMAILNKG